MTFLDTVRYFPQFHFACHIVHRVLILRMRKRYSRLSAEQVAEIPAKKLKRGRRKKSWPKEFVAEF